MNITDNSEREWSGIFDIDNYSFFGKLIHNRQTGKILLFIDKKIDSQEAAKKFKVLHFKKKDLIRGELTSGWKIELYNIQCITLDIPLCANEVFIVKYVIFPNKEDTSEGFNELQCKVENALEWSNLSRRNIDIDFNVQYLTQDNPRQFKWFGAKISFSVIRNRDIWNGIQEETYKIDEHLIFSIYSETKQNINYFMDIRDKLLAVISFAIGNNVNIIQQHLGISNHTSFCNFGLITNEPYYLIDLRNDIKFKLNELPNGLKLDSKIEKLFPLINLYLSQIKYSNMPCEMEFLNLIQAVEAFHAIFFCNEHKSKKRYINRIKTQYSQFLHNAACERMLMSADRQLKDDIDFVCLYSRLNELIFDNNSQIFSSLYATNENDNEFICDIVKTRNYFTHYDADYLNEILKDEELIKATSFLRVLLDYHICKILGMDITSKTKIAMQQL